MKFKKMEIYGFKSFADKVQIDFNEGVTGIVGPNGCGKSNVADSIRWVLGEQSAKALRGSSMQDVIFNGTEKRKPQSFSEVSLIFDNTEKIFNIDYDEVVLSRKLYRSGDSEYAINKAPCRLKDITDLLRDSGLGRESYNIIGQGRIDELLSAKPEERRAVFEDAAGISKLKNRKYESLKKLNTTSENLTRINDILHELEIQLGPLKEQAETAKKYLEYREKLKVLDANNYVFQYDTSSFKKAEIQNRLDGVIEEIALKEDAFQKCIDDYANTAEELSRKDSEIDNLRDELLNLTVGLEKQAGESRLLQEKITTLNEQKEKYEKSIESETEEQQRDNSTIERLTETKKVKLTALEELTRKVEQLAQDILVLQAEINDSEAKLQENSAKLVESLGKLGDIKAEISSLNTEKVTLENRINETEEKILEINNKKSEYESQEDVIRQQIKELNNQKAQVVDSQIREKQENLKLLYKISSLEEEIKDYIAMLSSNNSKMKLLQAMQQENEGYVASVKRILKDSLTDASLAGRFVNVVAKLMKVPEEFENAIDIALGASVQNIVTKNEDDAKYVIEYLKDNNLGRATFLPMTSVKPRTIQDEYRRYISREMGVYGVADELIEFSKEYENIFSSLLGGTVIVEDMDVAIRIARQCKYSFKIVTLDGDIINPTGTMAGGSKKAQAVSLIGREREIQSLIEELANAQQEKEAKEQELAAAKIQRDSQATMMEGFEAELKDIESKISRANEELSKYVALREDIESNINSLSQQKASFKNGLDEIRGKITVFENYQSEIASGKVDENSIKNPELYLKKNKLFALTEEHTELKVKRASIEGELVSIDGELLRLKDEKEQAIKRLQILKLDYQRCLTELEGYSTQFESKVDKTVYNQSLQSLQGVRDKLAKSDEEKKSLSLLLSDLSEQKLILSGEVQRAHERKFKEENALLKIDTDIEQLQEKIWEDYGLTYATAAELRIDGHNLEEGLIESAKIKRQISALGNVNVNAIEMLGDVSHRYDDLSVQRDDLEKAQTDLNGIIGNLTTEMEGRFLTEFNKINTNFQGVFKELFGGGRAELRLLDETNPLECGIEIAAEPTGKKLQNITLLSGGERALTAIAILFAILKLKPMPFCVLDEIEAALDDANVERFAKYLKRFSNYTQFIVITHRKPTMELADSLYGVTMEERGVSKIVSVKLADAIKNSSKDN